MGNLIETVTGVGESIINLVNTRANTSLTNLDATGEARFASIVGGSGGGGVKPSVCKNMVIDKNDSVVKLKWEDPGDTVIDKQVVSSWGGTLIVKKEGSYPINEQDGEIVVDNKVKNAYLETPLVDSIVSGTDMYYKAFPYNTDNAYTYNDKNNFVDAIIYEFTINPNDSNPATRVQYPAGCVNENFTPCFMDFTTGQFDYGDWEHAFFQPRPVMVKYDGTVDYELYKPNFAYKADGVTASDYNNTSYAGNCMIAFPQVWMKFELGEGNLQHVYISNKQVDETYHCWTHYNRLGVLVDEIFIQAFTVSYVTDRNRSIGGLNATVNTTGTVEIERAQKNGDNWNLIDFAMYNMLGQLLTLMGKSTDTQSTYGYGWGQGSSGAVNNPTGILADKGMFYATSATSANRIKVFGIEDLWGNTWKRCNGCCYSTTDGLRYKMTETTIDGSSVTGYNTDGTGYLTNGVFSGTSGGYISATKLTEHGIFPATASGSATTYNCDGLWWANGGFASVGGSWNNTSKAGVLALTLDDAVSYSSSAFGGSLSCKPSS